MNKKTQALIANIVTYIVLAVVGVVILVPCLFMLSTSLKSEANLFQVPIQWIPNPMKWSNYIDSFAALDKVARGLTFWRVLMNTLFMTLLGMTAELCAVSVVACGFSRFRFKGRKVISSQCSQQ